MNPKLRTLTLIAAIIGGVAWITSCEKDDMSDRMKNLTTAVWLSDSLLVNGVDASGPGQILASFKGEVIFNKDGTGTFGPHTGTWRFAMNETELVIESPNLPLPLSTRIHELTKSSLKVSTSFPNINDPLKPLQIRLTFKAK